MLSWRPQTGASSTSTTGVNFLLLCVRGRSPKRLVLLVIHPRVTNTTVGASPMGTR